MTTTHTVPARTDTNRRTDAPARAIEVRQEMTGTLAGGGPPVPVGRAGNDRVAGAVR